ncbi:FAD-dependent tricarballylate dehydrogenase TcuA [Dehalococcoidia bacterium]|nr:FAD-dependent tricarballylate dehydrogenase TcuA [Dehalococcoidia bacterium]
MTRKFDVIIVGAGNAALTAALSARQHGAKVLVCEKAPETERGGNSRFSGGLFRFSYDGLEDLKQLRQDLPKDEWDRVEPLPYEPDHFLDDVMRVTAGQADPDLTNILIGESYSTVRWMTDLGMEWQWTVLWNLETEGKLRFSPGSVLEAKGKGVGLMQRLFAMTLGAGIEVSYGAEMVGFLTQDGAVSGIKVRTRNAVEDIAAKAVILASGGFEADPLMRAEYLGPHWEQVVVRGTRFNTGETLRMALEIGARPFGEWDGCHATPIDAASPRVGDLKLTDRTNRLSYPFSVMVNNRGERFVDEGEDLGGYTYAKTGRAILAQPGAVGYQIFDSKTIALIEERYSTGRPLVADTIADLARLMSVPSDRLVLTVDQFNEAVQPGDFDPGAKDGKSTRGIVPAKSNWALPLDSPPFTAYPVTCGITFTFGGVQIDGTGRVIHVNGDPIPGLFATGEITGGFFYNNYPGGTGLMRGAVFGKIAGANAASG